MKKEAVFPKNKTIARVMLKVTVIMMVTLFLLLSISGIISDLRAWHDEKKVDAFSDIAFFIYAVGKDELLHYFYETKQYYEEIADLYSDDETAPGAPWIRDEEYEKIHSRLRRLSTVKGTNSIALFFYDEDRSRIVYVFNAGIALPGEYDPGQWVSAKSEDISSLDQMINVSQARYSADYRYSAATGWTVTEYIPFRDKNHNLVGFFSYNLMMEEIEYRILSYLLFTSLFVAFLIIIAGIVFIMVVRKRVVEPITEIADSTNAFSELGSDALMDGERVFAKLDMAKETPRELMILTRALQNMEDSVGTSLVKINNMTKEKERMNAELAFAAEIQRTMLPELDDVIASDERFSLYATMRPAKSVGGDFYDFFMLDEVRLAFLVADVSDKGIGAALFMAVSKSVIATRMRSGGTPAEVLGYADAILSEGNDESMFVTVFLAVLDLRTGEVSACNAGHAYPFVCFGKEGGDYRMLEQEHGFPLAFFAGIDMHDPVFPTLTWNLSPGDRIFLYTDGVNEAQGKNDIQFGNDRVKAVLDSHRRDNDKTVCDSMLKEVDEFLKDEPQFDDITMISLTYMGNK